MMATGSIGGVLRDLRSRMGGIGTALVSRSGRVLFADLPGGVFAETFAFVRASTLGAATAADGELNLVGPERIVIEGRDSTTVIVPSRDDALLVAVVGGSAESETALSEVAKFADFLKGGPGSSATV